MNVCKSIEAEQLKRECTGFNVDGDTVKVYAKIKEVNVKDQVFETVL